MGRRSTDSTCLRQVQGVLRIAMLRLRLMPRQRRLARICPRRRSVWDDSIHVDSYVSPPSLMLRYRYNDIGYPISSDIRYKDFPNRTSGVGYFQEKQNKSGGIYPPFHVTPTSRCGRSNILRIRAVIVTNIIPKLTAKFSPKDFTWKDS